MKKLSAVDFSWYKQPAARMKGEFIIPGGGSPPRSKNKYYPAEYSIEILNALKGVYGEKDAIQFVRDWGYPGNITSDRTAHQWIVMLYNISDYIYYSNRLQEDLSPNFIYPPELTEEEENIKDGIQDEVLKNINQAAKTNDLGIKIQRVYARHIPARDRKSWIRVVAHESAEYILRLAENVRKISLMIYLQNKYKKAFEGLEDYYVVEKEAEECINNTPHPYYKSFSLKDCTARYNGYKKRNKEIGVDVPESLNEYILNHIVSTLRNRISSLFFEGIQLRLQPQDGQPQIKFDSLFVFIYYELLRSPGYNPERCHDPKCSQIFFQSRMGQAYCPPITPEQGSRSRCEQRHSQQLRREAKKKTRKE